MEIGPNEGPRVKSRQAWKRYVVFAFLCVGALGGAWFFLSPRSIPSGSMLVLDLTAPTEERSGEGLSQLLAGAEIDVVDLWRCLRSAASDPRVEGLLLRIYPGAVQLGLVDELRGLVTQFRSSGKVTIAQLNAPDTPGYFLATAAEEVLLDRSTTLDTVGVRMNAYFLKDALGAMGVEADLVRVGSFKGAFEELSRSVPSPEFEVSMNALVDSLFESILEPIASARRINVNAVRAAFDRSPLGPDEAQAEKLIDGVISTHEVRRRIEEKAGKPLHWISVAEYRSTLSAGPGARRLALVHVLGTLIEGESRELPWIGFSTGADTVVRSLNAALEDPGIVGILLRIDSPGGVVSAAEKVQLAVESARKLKPVVASCGRVAASGGYYAACSAERILAHPTTLTGSIGIFGGKIVLGDLLARLKVEARTYSRGEHATMNDFTRKYTAEERLALKSMLENSYRKFVSKVALGRKKSFEAIDAVAQGRVWTGRAALAAGLVDRLGGFFEAVDALVEFANLDLGEAIELELFPAQKTIWEALSGLKRPATGVGQSLEVQSFEFLQNLSSFQQAGLLDGISALSWMPFSLETR